MSDPIPKKALGQHWLHDTATLVAICDAAQVQTGDTVLEVGPGLGTLTKQLLQRHATVTAVEYDPTLADGLRKMVWEDGPPNIIQQDILEFDLTTLPAGYKVVANIPYYLTSNLIRVLCESANPFSTAAILIQKEVAERVAAQPGQMSLLSVSAQYYCDVSLGPMVPAKMFTPPPKVDSQVLVLRYRTQPLFKAVDTKQFFRLVKAGFSQKRKTLVNSLSGGLATSKDQARSLLQAANIPENTRAQALSLDEWHRLYQASSQQKS
ncbi:MAG TPA: 16S rRNA (adenine(1518)-N(6)/adenine(1519)-N(6))-dimethyltransferase RsmA [Candidatus Saccharimonadales bacterium]|nr:16S rRNA (adenine(1518)-N(6)/adenine(1519)-N(6))-dimethyltransferase RsmA [Candidatus Saccharimonadales bacterium]